MTCMCLRVSKKEYQKEMTDFYFTEAMHKKSMRVRASISVCKDRFAKV